MVCPVPDFDVRVSHDSGAAAALWARLPVDHPYQRLDWASDWLATEGTDSACIVSVVDRRNHRPWLLLPLVRHRVAGLRTLSWVGGHLTDYPVPLVGPDCPESVLSDGFPTIWKAIRRALPTADLLLAPRQLPTVAGRPNPLVQLRHTMSAVSAHHAHPGPDWEAFYRSHCSGRTRRRHNQKLRQMARVGPVRFSVVTHPTQARAVLPTFFDMKARGYQRLGVANPLASPAARAFLERQVVDPGRPGHLSILTVGDQIWAAHVGWVHDGTLYMQFPTYRLGALSSASPGAALIRHLLRHAVETGLHTVDFTIGDDPHKNRWCDDHVPLVDVVEPLSMRGLAVTSGTRAWTRVKRHLKQCPTTYDALRTVRSTLAGG